MKKFKIIVISSMYPNSVMYRSGIFIHEQVKELLKKNVDITVIAPVPVTVFPMNLISKKYLNYSKIPQEELFEGVKIYHPRFIAIPGGFLKQFWPYLYYILVKPIVRKIISTDFETIIHVHGGLPDDYGSTLLAKHFKLKTVLTIHGASIYNTVGRKSWFNKTRSAIESANYVVTVSNNLKSKVLEFTKRQKNLSTIYNGIAFYDLPKKRNENNIRIISVAHLIERKGIIYAIIAFKNIVEKIDNIEFRIIGNGPLEQELKLFVKKNNLNDKIKFEDFKPHKVVLEEINNSDIFILPSWNEAFGVVYIEAMSMKVPIIGTKREGIADIITDGENGYLVESKNVSELTAKLEELIYDENLRYNMGIKGYETVKEMTWVNNAKKYIDIYESLVDRVS